MARHKYATIEKFQDGSYLVYFGDISEKLTMTTHVVRVTASNKEEAIEKAIKYTKPIRGSINFLKGGVLHPMYIIIKPWGQGSVYRDRVE